MMCRMTDISRRQFVALAAAGAGLAPFAPAQNTITAQQIIDRIRSRLTRLDVEWKTASVDTVKAGDATAAITGIATTALPTVDVLRRAVKAGANMVITCGPTFYSRTDTPTLPSKPGAAAAPDAILSAKDEFIRKNGLVVWRFSDHWRLRAPNPFARGLADALGWSTVPIAGDPAALAIPETSLDALAARVKQRLAARGGIRVVGNPGLRVRKVGLLPGSTPVQASLALLPAVDVVIAGEVREWESVEYARDTLTAGGAKALMLVGRVVSEDPGMQACAQWLGSVVPELKTTWLAAGDPYWRPR